MSTFEVDLPAVDAAAVQLGAAATAVDAAAGTLCELRLRPEQAGVPDGEVVAEAVRRFAERVSRGIEDNGRGLRGDALSLRTAAARYANADQALAGRLRTIR